MVVDRDRAVDAARASAVTTLAANGDRGSVGADRRRRCPGHRDRRDHHVGPLGRAARPPPPPTSASTPPTSRSRGAPMRARSALPNRRRRRRRAARRCSSSSRRCWSALSDGAVRPRLAAARDGRAVALDARRDPFVVAPAHRSAGHLERADRPVPPRARSWSRGCAWPSSWPRSSARSSSSCATGCRRPGHRNVLGLGWLGPGGGRWADRPAPAGRSGAGARRRADRRGAGVSIAPGRAAPLSSVPAGRPGSAARQRGTTGRAGRRVDDVRRAARRLGVVDRRRRRRSGERRRRRRRGRSSTPTGARRCPTVGGSPHRR